MIIKEFYETRKDGINLYRTYSDEGFYIIQNETGTEYSEAIDVEGSLYTYSETNKPIKDSSQDDPMNPDEISDSEALAIIRGEI